MTEPVYHSFDVQQAFFLQCSLLSPVQFIFIYSVCYDLEALYKNPVQSTNKQLWQESKFRLKGRHLEYYQTHLGDHPAG